MTTISIITRGGIMYFNNLDFLILGIYCIGIIGLAQYVSRDKSGIEKTSEDYFLSRKYSPRKFRIIKHHFGQDSRRFKKMGYFGMATYLIKNFINRNNKRYWDSLDSSKYWN